MPLMAIAMLLAYPAPHTTRTPPASSTASPLVLLLLLLRAWCGPALLLSRGSS